MTWLGNYLNMRENRLANSDMIIYGTGIVSETTRHWLNPMRYLLGDRKIKRIHPGKVVIHARNYKPQR